LEEGELAALCGAQDIDQVVFAYSDVDHGTVMHRASVALAAGADFVLLGPDSTMIDAAVPVISVCAVRTGCGKSQVTRWLSRRLTARGLKVAAIRHPMPYGDLARQAVQRFATKADLDTAECTVEEREEYEPYIALGSVMYAGVDYEAITRRAEAEADVILWDGGNNDFSFLRPDLQIALVDPMRPSHEETHHPGEAVLRMADIALIVKTDVADAESVARVEADIERLNPRAQIVRGASPVTLDRPEAVRGQRVLVIEDGPTITHGGMAFGAGYVAAEAAGAGKIVDPRGAAEGEIADLYQTYPHIGTVLPAVGYFPAQLRALAETINRADVDAVIAATPCDLGALIDIDKPVVRATYEFAEADGSRLGALVDGFLTAKGL
jgi:predicted GTPase